MKAPSSARPRPKRRPARVRTTPRDLARWHAARLAYWAALGRAKRAAAGREA